MAIEQAGGKAGDSTAHNTRLANAFFNKLLVDVIDVNWEFERAARALLRLQHQRRGPPGCMGRLALGLRRVARLEGPSLKVSTKVRCWGCDSRGVQLPGLCHRSATPLMAWWKPHAVVAACRVLVAERLANRIMQLLQLAERLPPVARRRACETLTVKSALAEHVGALERGPGWVWGLRPQPGRVWHDDSSDWAWLSAARARAGHGAGAAGGLVPALCAGQRRGPAQGAPLCRAPQACPSSGTQTDCVAPCPWGLNPDTVSGSSKILIRACLAAPWGSAVHEHVGSRAGRRS